MFGVTLLLSDHASPLVGGTVAAAPREVTLWFTQSLEPAFSSPRKPFESGRVSQSHYDSSQCQSLTEAE